MQPIATVQDMLNTKLWVPGYVGLLLRIDGTTLGFP